MRRAVLLALALLTACADDEPGVIAATGPGRTHFVHVSLSEPAFVKDRPHVFSIPQIVLVRDAVTGEIVTAFRQGNTHLQDAWFYVPAKYFRDGEARLTFEPSSPWADGDEMPVKIVSVEPLRTAEVYHSYEIAFGKPDDLPFLGDNVQYAEGMLTFSEWAAGKFFRYAETPSSLRIPIDPGDGFLKTNFYYSAHVNLSLDGKKIATLLRSTGKRFDQDFYRVPFSVEGGLTHNLRVETVDPFRVTPPNLRQMAFAFDSIEISSPAGERFDLFDALNARLDYRHGERVDDVVAGLARYQGGAWLPNREPIDWPEGSNREIDALVVLDPVLNDVANSSYSTGDEWLNGALGAAMMLEHFGYSVAYGTPDDIERISPKVIYVPSQPFYRGIDLDAIRASGATVIVEPSLSGEFAAFRELTGITFRDTTAYVVRDRVDLRRGTANGLLQITPVMEHDADPALTVEATLRDHGLAVAYSKPGTGVTTFPAGFLFYNYGQRAVRDIVGLLLAEAPEPAVRAVSDSQVRAYVIGRGECSTTVMLENNNFGAMNYYGFNEAHAVEPSETPPPIGEVELVVDGRSLTLTDVAGDRVVTVPGC